MGLTIIYRSLSGSWILELEIDFASCSTEKKKFELKRFISYVLNKNFADRHQRLQKEIFYYALLVGRSYLSCETAASGDPAVTVNTAMAPCNHRVFICDCRDISYLALTLCLQCA